MARLWYRLGYAGCCFDSRGQRAAGGASATGAAPPENAPAAQPPGMELVSLHSVEKSLSQKAAEAWAIVQDVWGIVLIKGTDGKPLITVGTLSGGLVLLGLGYLAAGMISRWVASRLLIRMGMNKSAVSPLQSISFYVLLAIFTMFSLNVLNVPLTVFSFLGGALAIGVGFGSQNIVNNFISGLILLAERPIRVGDVIQIDGLAGIVTNIGARSTRSPPARIRRSSFPTASCWRRTSSTGRSPTTPFAARFPSALPTARRPARSSGCCCRRLSEHPQVAEGPGPAGVCSPILGPTPCCLSCSFWLHLRDTGRPRSKATCGSGSTSCSPTAESCIAYPQRDVHLNVMRPVEVRLTQPSVSLSESRRVSRRRHRNALRTATPGSTAAPSPVRRRAWCCADPSQPKPTIHVIAYGADGLVQRNPATPDEAHAFVGQQAITWINVEGLGDAAHHRAAGRAVRPASPGVGRHGQRPPAGQGRGLRRGAVHRRSAWSHCDGPLRHRADQHVRRAELVLTFQEGHPGDSFDRVRAPASRQRRQASAIAAATIWPTP